MECLLNQILKVIMQTKHLITIVISLKSIRKIIHEYINNAQLLRKLY